MSTHPVQRYLSYLQTDVLVESLTRVEQDLLTKAVQKGPVHRRTLLSVREDILAELKRRQLEFTWPSKLEDALREP